MGLFKRSMFLGMAAVAILDGLHRQKILYVERLPISS